VGGCLSEGAILPLLEQRLTGSMVEDGKGERRTVGGGKAKWPGRPRVDSPRPRQCCMTLSRMTINVDRIELKGDYGSGLDGPPCRSPEEAVFLKYPISRSNS
jgi:hypothetical protein